MNIFVISLKTATDRRKKITATMKKLGLDFEFFDAVDGRNGLPKKYQPMIDRTQAKKRLGKNMSEGEIACALSHALVYKKIVDKKIQHSIILEDDCIIDKDFAKMVKNKLCEKSCNDFIYLYHLYGRAVYGTKNKFLNGYNTVKLAKTPTGAVGYYLTLETAEKLLQKVLPISWVSDWGVDVVNMVDTVAITPRIVKHPPMEQSVLESNRTGNKSVFGQFGFLSTVCYKFKKIFSYKISNSVTGD